MKPIKIYTAGKMSGLSYQEQMCWRREIERYIRNKTDKHLTFIHPPVFYQYDNEDGYQSDREIKNWDLTQIRDSDIVIVSLDGVNSSIGTHYELGFIDAINSFGNKHIFVIGIGESKTPLYPWIKESLHRQEPDWKSAADYIMSYLLV